MSNLALVLLAVIGLFGLLVTAKHYSKNLKYCAICLAVSVTWLTLLVLLWLGEFSDQTLLAILMGQSSLGLYYLAEKHAPKPLLVFRLPLLVSLTAIVYAAVTRSLSLDALAVIVGLWLVIGALYTWRSSPKLQRKAKALIECCSDW